MPNEQAFVTCTPAQAEAEIKAIDKLISGLETRIEKAQKYTRFNTDANLGRSLHYLKIARQLYEPKAGS